jgi:hypothetical protein
MKQLKKTSLEKSDNIEDTLKWKLKTIGEKNLPTESGIADYIALGIKNLEKEVEYIKSIEADYKKEREVIVKQIEAIKIDGAKFFQDAGIVKIEGVICSSITLTKQKVSETIEKVEKVFTPLITSIEIEELLLGLGKAEMKKVTTSKTSNAIPAKLAINKRKEK